MSFCIYGFYIEQKGHFYTNRPFYIGKTSIRRLKFRMWQHEFFAHVAQAEKGKYKSEKGLTFLYKAISKFVAKGLTWKYRVIKEVETEEEVFELEQKLIFLMGRIVEGTGWLYNVTSGGTGGTMSEETKRKIQESLLKRPENFWTQEKMEYAKEQYLLGMSLEKLKKIFNVSSETLAKKLKLQDVILRTEEERHKNHKINPICYGWTPEKLQLIKSLYESGKSTKEIAKIVNFNSVIVSKRLKEQGVIIKHIRSDHGIKSHVKHYIPDEIIQECIRLYDEEKLSLPKIVIKLNLEIGVDALRKRLYKLGFKERTREEAAAINVIKFNEIQLHEIKELYNNIKQIRPIARKFNVTRPVIKRVLAEQGVL